MCYGVIQEQHRVEKLRIGLAGNVRFNGDNSLEKARPSLMFRDQTGLP